MDCNTCEGKHTELKSISLAAFESMEASMERTIKRLWIALVMSVLFIFFSNVAWLWAWVQYDYTSEETVTTYQQDGRGLNIIGDSNEVDRYGSEEDSYCAEEDPST